MIIKNYDYLPSEAKSIRINVFIEEQGFVNEFDSIDDIATHIVLFVDDRAVATGRFYTENNEDYYIGRLAVIKEYRGRGLGSEIINEAEHLIRNRGAKKILLHSQCQAVSFYKRLGYSEFGEKDFDELCEHQWMNKKL